MSATALSIRIALLLALCLGVIGFAVRARLSRRRIEPPAGATEADDLDAATPATTAMPEGAPRGDIER